METLLPEKVYQRLKQRIFSGEFTPGTRLDYQRLAAQLGVSTTPIREAMARLASEGLVNLVPRAGAAVRQMERNEIAQLYGVREAIETHVVALASEKLSAGDLWQLESLVAKMDAQITAIDAMEGGCSSGERFAEFNRCDFAFHMTIIEASGNPRLARLAGEGEARAYTFDEVRLPCGLESLREENRSHTAILEAIKQHDAVRAVVLVRQHIRNCLDLTLERASFLRQPDRWSIKLSPVAA